MKIGSLYFLFQCVFRYVNKPWFHPGSEPPPPKNYARSPLAKFDSPLDFLVPVKSNVIAPDFQHNSRHLLHSQMDGQTNMIKLIFKNKLTGCFYR